MTTDAALELITRYDLAGDGEALKSRELIRMLLEHSPSPFSRDQFTPGHITATACVLHPSEDAVLVIHHKRLDRWLLPGGHVEEEDRVLAGTALREAMEETAVEIAPGGGALVGMDVHGIPAKRAEPYHLHHDFMFGFVATSTEVALTEETRGAAWCPFGKFDGYRLAGSIQRATLRAWRWKQDSRKARASASS